MGGLEYYLAGQVGVPWPGGEGGRGYFSNIDKPTPPPPLNPKPLPWSVWWPTTLCYCLSEVGGCVCGGGVSGWGGEVW